ncbi:hypothetical protein Vadar_033976 [Vaccinium darrowii]|uniref:Uncharacterized protein n=1 Tax=Vaccinium darrowii TaxID=229202 RepID=A0ACB7Y581_9ERIC|nr:hypothetical protein Vadar_033976 [Vaccinium darrowii]
MDLVSLYVDNIPTGVDVAWLRSIFNNHGQVIEAFIPVNRVSKYNTKFGFVRFKTMEEALEAIHALNGKIVQNFCIHVRIARFSSAKRSYVDRQKLQLVGSNEGGICGQFLKKNVWPPTLDKNQVSSTKGNFSYTEALNGFKNSPKLIDLEAFEVDWLERSVVGRLISYCNVNSLQNIFISNEIWDAHIRSLGGLNVLLTFDTKESMEDFIKDKNNCLPKWFSSVEVWKQQKIIPSRCVWLSCFGVPLNAWNNNTFISIGNLWGEVIKLDELTANSIAFDKGRMFVLTDCLDCINEVVHVKIKEDIFPVKVVEDPFAETSWENRIVTTIKIKTGRSGIEAVEEDDVDTLGSEEGNRNKVEMVNEKENAGFMGMSRADGEELLDSNCIGEVNSCTKICDDHKLKALELAFESNDKVDKDLVNLCSRSTSKDSRVNSFGCMEGFIFVHNKLKGCGRDRAMEKETHA